MTFLKLIFKLISTPRVGLELMTRDQAWDAPLTELARRALNVTITFSLPAERQPVRVMGMIQRSSPPPPQPMPARILLHREGDRSGTNIRLF